MKTKRTITSFLCLAALIACSGIYAQEKVLSLQEAREMALKNNNSLKKAAQNTQAAQAAEQASRTLNKPSLDAGLMGLYLSDPINTLLPEYSGNASLALTQLVYAGGKINYAKKAASKAVEMSQLQNQLATGEVLLKTETTYWNIANLNEKVILSKKYISLLETLLNDLNNSFNAGLIYKNDVLRVQVQINAAQLDLKRVQDGLILSRMSLAQLIGSQNSDFIIAADFKEDYILPFEEEGRVKSLGRPETALLKSTVEINELQSNMLNASRRPTVALSANGLYASGKAINFSNGKDQMAAFYGLVNVSIPIFDWGNRKLKVREQDFKTEAQKTELQEVQQLIALEVRDAYLLLGQAKNRVALTRESLSSAEENLRLYNDRFEAGTVTGKDVLEAQVLWQQAYSEHIDADAAYKITKARYKKAINDLR